MGVFSRLGNVIDSYFNNFAERTNNRFNPSGDPDLDEAYAELNDFLNDKKPRNRSSGGSSRSGSSGSDNGGKGSFAGIELPPEELRADFEKLGVPFGAGEKTCKAAYKKLLKIHHPDRHAGHSENFKKATERMARINASMDRIEKWQQKKK